MGFPDMYGRMMGKRFDADFFLDSAAEDGTHACDYLLACDMEMVPIPVRIRPHTLRLCFLFALLACMLPAVAAQPFPFLSPFCWNY
jgi:hypothetical protein